MARPGPERLGALTTAETRDSRPDEPAPTAAERARAGLCADCRWARRVTSGRGSVFLLCRRAESDPAFPRYPRLPRVVCSGYEGAAPGL